MSVDGAKGSATPTEVELIATSTNYQLGRSVECRVKFSSSFISKNSTSLHNARPNNAIFVSDSAESIKNIRLDEQIVGPNIQFILQPK